jgi:DNA-binding CsgD family transcriptional regulator
MAAWRNGLHEMRGVSRVSADAEQPSADIAPVSLTSKYHHRLSLADTELILKLHANGQQQTDIAQIIGCSQSTVSETIAKLKQSPEITQALMRSDSLSAITDWKRARKQAAKRGDHRPSREWLEAAYPELRPQQGNSAGGGGVTINIGMPGSPIALPTIEIAPVSPRKQLELSEGEQNR